MTRSMVATTRRRRAPDCWRFSCLLCGRTEFSGRLAVRRCGACGGFMEALEWSEWERGF